MQQPALEVLCRKALEGLNAARDLYNSISPASNQAVVRKELEN
jgi:hypothetical protein